MAELVKYTEITDELLKILKIHLTPSSLRRDCSMADEIIEQAATEKCPRLFYVRHKDNWEYHACETDMTKFLWKQSAGESGGETPEEPIELIHSKLAWDGVIGGNNLVTSIVANHEGHEPAAVECLQCDGEVAYDETLQGNYIGFTVTFDEEMLTEYGEPTYEAEDDRFQFIGIENNVLSGYVRVDEPGQASYFKINWNGVEDAEFNPEEFGIEVLQSATLG